MRAFSARIEPKKGNLSVNDKEPCTSERFIRDILARFPDPSGIIVPPAAYLPEGSLAARADRAFEPLIQKSQDACAFTTTSATPQEPLTFERMTQFLEELKELYQWPEPPVEILSPAEYFRRLPLSEETLAELEAPTPLTRIKQELIYGTSFLNIKDFHLPYRVPEGTEAMSLEKAQQMIEILKAQHATAPHWVISPKTHHQLARLAGRKRRQYRAWLRTKRKRRARQRRHQRGQQR